MDVFIWTPTMEFILIELIKERPVLWDNTHKDFRKKYLKIRNYNNISEVLCKVFPECAELFQYDSLLKKFNSFKSYYFQECKRLEKLPRDNGQTSKWRHFEQMSFMKNAGEYNKNENKDDCVYLKTVHNEGHALSKNNNTTIPEDCVISTMEDDDSINAATEDNSSPESDSNLSESSNKRAAEVIYLVGENKEEVGVDKSRKKQKTAEEETDLCTNDPELSTYKDLEQKAIEKELNSSANDLGKESFGNYVSSLVYSIKDKKMRSHVEMKVLEHLHALKYACNL